jgi:uncharacterized protein with HEPN domain
VTRSVEQSLNGILDAIARARVADRRMRLGESLCDEAGVQIAFQAILHNLVVIDEALRAIPAEILERTPEAPWSEFAAVRDLIAPDYLHIDPATVHRTIEEDLGRLDTAVRRLRAAQ